MGKQDEEHGHREKNPQVEPEEENKSKEVGPTDVGEMSDGSEATVKMSNSEASQENIENVEGQDNRKRVNKEELKEDESLQEEKGENSSESEQVQTDTSKLDKNNKREKAENRYIAMMVGKIKELSSRGEIESAIKYLETLQSEISFSEKEKGQFLEIMKVLQKARIRKINKKYFSEDNREIETEER